MKRRILIHAGLPKCGSTSLQFILASNRTLLAERGVFYPDITPDNELSVGDEIGDAQRMSHMLLSRAIADAGKRHATQPCPLLADVIDDFRASGHETLLLSSESFAMRALRFKMSAVEPLLDDFDVTIVLFLRRHDAWVTSFYKQNVKTPGRRYGGSFDDFIASPPTQASDMMDFSIADRLEGLRNAFGAVSVRLFDLDIGVGDTLALMGDMLGFKITEWQGQAEVLRPYNRSLFERGLPINLSLSDVATVFLAEFNRLAKADPLPSDDFREITVALSNFEFAEKYRRICLLSPAISANLLAASLKDRQDLERRFGFAVPVKGAVSNIGDHRQTLRGVAWQEIADVFAPTLPGQLRSKFLAVAERA